MNTEEILVNVTAQLVSRSGKHVGSGVFLADQLFATCAHRVRELFSRERQICDFGGSDLGVRLRATATDLLPLSHGMMWNKRDSAEDLEDIAVFLLQRPALRGIKAGLTVPEGTIGNRCATLGFTKNIPSGEIARGVVGYSLPNGLIQIDPTGRGFTVDHGYSGSPVWVDTGIIGLISSGVRSNGVGFAIKSTSVVRAAHLFLDNLRKESDVQVNDISLDLPMSRNMRESISDVYKLCFHRRIPYRTAHTMAALMKGGQLLRRALDHVRGGLAKQTDAWLQSVARSTQGSPVSDLQAVFMRPEFEEARNIGTRHRLCELTEREILVGLFRCKSKTSEYFLNCVVGADQREFFLSYLERGGDDDNAQGTATTDLISSWRPSRS